MFPAFTHATCHVNLAAIERNFRKLGDPERLMPVIKSDAYGHGIGEVARTLSAVGAAGFAVGTVSEGLFLRSQGHCQRVLLLLGCKDSREAEQALNADLLPFAGSFEALELICAANSQKKRIALKFDTGMGRLGFSIGQLPELLDWLRAHPEVEPVLAGSHLATADMPEKSADTRKQIEDFAGIIAALRELFPEIEGSLGNSAALGLKVGGLMRPGIALYGGNPFAGTPQEGHLPPLEWAMALEAPILQVKTLPAGSAISYGGLYRAPRPVKAAVVAAGYANGISRGLSGSLSVLIRGRRCPQIGRICMGMFMVDVTGLADAAAGDSAWIMGGEAVGEEKAPTPLEVAELQGSIPYEVLCLAGSLNPRKFHRD